MIQEDKQHLPIVLYGITSRIYALFFQKLVLLDEEILQAKHIRHYDYECEGLMNLINFLQRKTTKNIILAFQTIKDPQSSFEDEEQLVKVKSLKQFQQKPSKNQLQGNTTGRTRFFTRANTSIQQSDNSFIYSPNIKKNIGRNRTQYFNSALTESGDRSEILQKLLKRVKKANADFYQQSLKPAKSSYFNLTLGGKQSLQTFQNNCNCNCSCNNNNVVCKNQNKQIKRKRILEKFQRIQRKIYNDTLPEQNYFTPRHANFNRKTYQMGNTYSVYEPLTFHQRPRQVVYVTPRPKNQHQKFKDYMNNGLSSSKSVTHINYAKKVYL